jgi:hypothetical protein
MVKTCGDNCCENLQEYMKVEVRLVSPKDVKNFKALLLLLLLLFTM